MNLSRHRFIGFATLILLVASALRFWQLSTYPYGPHYDEAVNLLISRSILNGSTFFPMVEAYQGREPLYMYLNAFLLPFLGDRMFTYHVTNAFSGVLMVAGAIGLCRAMFRGSRGLLIGLVVGLLITFNFPLLWLSRQAFRAVLLPLMQTFTLFCLWRGLITKRHAWRWLIAGGLLAGGAVYTYNSSRLFPFWLALSALVLLFADRSQWRLRLQQGAYFFIPLLIVALPMGVYAFQRPDIFWGRLEEVTQADQSVSLVESIWLHLKMFFLQGDPYFRYNISERPYFTFPEGIFLIIGFLIAGVGIIRQKQSLTHLAYFMALISPLMIIPSVISVGGIPPSHMRSLGMVPLIFILTALGVEFVYKKCFQPTARGNTVFQWALVITLLVGALNVSREYFAWASSSPLYYESHQNFADAATWLLSREEIHDANTHLYIASSDRNHPTIEIQNLPRVHWLGTSTLFRPPQGQQAIILFIDVPIPPDWASWLDQTAHAYSDIPQDPVGDPAFRAFLVDGTADLPSLSQPSAPALGNSFLGYLGYQQVETATGIDVVTYWNVLNTPTASDLTPHYQLWDERGNLIQRGDVFSRNTDTWQVGAVLAQRVSLTFPPDLPPEDYHLSWAWIAQAEDQYVHYIRDGQDGGLWTPIAEIDLSWETPRQAEALVIDRPEAHTFGDITLLGWNDSSLTLRQGEVLPLQIFWTALIENPSLVEYSIQLTQAENQFTLRPESPLFDDSFDMTRWPANSVLVERLRLPLDHHLPAGEYALEFVTSRGEAVHLGQITVLDVERNFEMPAVQISESASFSDEIALQGYSLQTSPEGWSIQLVWQALTIPRENYTQFVHVLDADGNILQQSDREPHDGQYPTSLWATGEYVLEVFTFTGAWDDVERLRVGWYLPATGQRLGEAVDLVLN